MMNLREKDDAWAAAFGGFMCGGVLGLPCASPANPQPPCLPHPPRLT